jgi:hypothetical protein
MMTETAMNENTNIVRLDTIQKLSQTLQALEAGEELSYYIAGHGFQSRYFSFSWQDAILSIDIQLPYGLLLSNTETQTNYELSLGVALRMAILLLTAENLGEARLEVFCDESGVSYSIYDGAGKVVDSGNDWTPIVKRLEQACAENNESITVVWP